MSRIVIVIFMYHRHKPTESYMFTWRHVSTCNMNPIPSLWNNTECECEGF
jgi:hypothetical protein